MKVCSIEGCSKPLIARGWCREHYYRWHRNGDPLAGRTVFKTPEESFAARTAQEGECLVWTANKNNFGYGQIKASGKSVLTHRYAWEKANGPIPEGVSVDHICRNPACCNVAHLRLVTHKQNHEHVDLYASNTSGYRGVSWSNKRKKWVATVTHNGKRVHAGYFHDVHEAGEAAKAKRIELYTHNDLDRQVAP